METIMRQTTFHMIWAWFTEKSFKHYSDTENKVAFLLLKLIP